MATVRLAEGVKHQRQVAVKVLREDLTASLGKERFLREITIAAGLSGPRILPLHDSRDAAGRLFYVMPYVDGPSLREKLLQGGELPIVDAVRPLFTMSMNECRRSRSRGDHDGQDGQRASSRNC